MLCVSGGVKCMESEFYQEKFRRNFLREVFKVFFFKLFVECLYGHFFSRLVQKLQWVYVFVRYV